MLPNHAPLVIAEQFGTLDALFPGRIDLGLGRAPGSDQRVAQAIRRTLETDPNAFPHDVLELQSYFADDGQTGIRATPGAGANPQIVDPRLEPVRRAARRDARPALRVRLAFRARCARPGDGDLSPRLPPSAALDKPYAMAGFNVFAADTDEEAEFLASSQQQAFVALRTGNPRQLPPPVAGYRESLPPQHAAILDHVLQCSAIGSPATIARGLAAFIERTGVDEVMVSSSIYDVEARKRSVRCLRNDADWRRRLNLRCGSEAIQCRAKVMDCFTTLAWRTVLPRHQLQRARPDAEFEW